MQVKTIRNTKTELEIEIIGENETLLQPITFFLSENKDVDYATIISDHPLAPSRRLFIRMNKGSPKDALKKAISFLETEMKTFTKQIK